jgi:hypothetical protein
VPPYAAMTDTQATAEQTPPTPQPQAVDPVSSVRAEKEALLAKIALEEEGLHSADFAPRANSEPTPEEVLEEVDPDALPPDELPPENAEPTPGGKPPQFRLRPRDKLEETAFQIRRRNADISLEQALAMAKEQLGQPPDGTSQPGATPKPETAPQPTLAELKQKRSDLKSQIREARASLDFETLDNLELELEKLDEEAIPAAREHEAVTVSERERQLTQTWDHATSEAVRLYPDAAQEGSELFQRIDALDKEMQQNGDPLFNDPKKPLILAQMAARELLIAPRVTPAASLQRQPQSQQQARQVAPAVSMTRPLAVSGSRSSSTPFNEIHAAIEQANTPQALEALRIQLLGV